MSYIHKDRCNHPLDKVLEKRIIDAIEANTLQSDKKLQHDIQIRCVSWVDDGYIFIPSVGMIDQNLKFTSLEQLMARK